VHTLLPTACGSAPWRGVHRLPPPPRSAELRLGLTSAAAVDVTWLLSDVALMSSA
jgi:hypothetical protein